LDLKELGCVTEVEEVEWEYVFFGRAGRRYKECGWDPKIRRTS
jgi:hypothetical protein